MRCGLQAQDIPITKSDLYGLWVLELEEKKQVKEKSIYLARAESDSIESSIWNSIAFLADNECIFNSSSRATLGFCATQLGFNSDKWNWDYNEKKKVISITTVDTLLKELSEIFPEEHAKLGSPKWITQIQMKVVDLSQKKMVW